MTDVFSKIKRTVTEPKIYAVLVESSRGQVLHLGVHHSLDEAYAAARGRIEMLSPHNPAEAIDVDLWNSMPARQAIAQLMDPSWANELVKLPEGAPENPVDIHLATVNQGQIVTGNFPPMLQKLLERPRAVQPIATPKATPTISDHIKDIKTKKNELMKKLIDDGSISQVEKLKSLLGPYSRRYVLRAIEKKNKL